MNLLGLWTGLKAEILHHPFLAAGGAALAGAEVALLARATVFDLLAQGMREGMGWLLNSLSVSMSIPDGDGMAEALNSWLSQRQHLARLRHVSLHRAYLIEPSPIPYLPTLEPIEACTDRATEARYCAGVSSGTSRRRGEKSQQCIGICTLSPAAGNHLIWFEGRPVLVSRQADKTKEKNGPTQILCGGYTLRMLGRNRNRLDRMLADVTEVNQPDDNRAINILTNDQSNWRSLAYSPMRDLATVMLDPQDKQGILADLDRFFTARERYDRLGIDWRYGLLLHGPPGTGKTSLAKALAGQYQLPLYILNLAAKGMTDDDLLDRLRHLTTPCFLLIEDIDSAFVGRQNQTGKKNSVTFKGVINALDGAASLSGVITIMTTNHLEKLDPALIREGRMDRWVHFGPATARAAAERFEQFFPTCPQKMAQEFGETAARLAVTMNQVQVYLMRHEASGEEAWMERETLSRLNKWKEEPEETGEETV